MNSETAMSGIMERLEVLFRCRGGFVMLLAGAITTLALPPVSWLWVLPIGLGLAYWAWYRACDSERPLRRQFWLGWCFGLGFFAAGLYWVSHAFLVQPEVYGWMVPFALLGLGAGLGLFSGLSFILAGQFSRLSAYHPMACWVNFAGAWMLVEWFRGWVLTGFPWNALGTVWAPYPLWSQGASWIGMFGLSLITVLLATALAAGGLQTFGVRQYWFRGAAVSFAFLVLLFGGGWTRLPAEPMPTQPNVLLRLVQPNIPQARKWDPAFRYENVLDQILMSQAPGWDKVTHVIWPESASTYPLDKEGLVYRKLVAQAAPHNGWLLTGAPRRTAYGEPLKIWNSIFAINEHGEIGDVHDKAHLVPFGEYVPFKNVLPLEKLTAGRVDYSPGFGPRTVRLLNTPAYSPLICYEIVFPEEVVASSSRPDDRPAWILNLTNDGWFGLSAGPYQHFAAAVLRAVEQGIPVVRAANTGISAVIDPYGRSTANLELGQKGHIDVELPQPLVLTVFAKIGSIGIIISVLGLLSAVNLIAAFKLRRF